MKAVSELKVKIFGDGADIASILDLSEKPFIKGFTTNPTLMSKAGVVNYEAFALQILQHISDRPVSFEVLADDEETMELQARQIAGWASNVFVKIPVTNTHREPMCNLIRRLSEDGVQVNVTATMTLEQVREVALALRSGAPSNVSVFAGRIADTGRDPVPMMIEALDIFRENEKTELIWASPRELLNIYQAEQIGCHVITVTDEILRKLNLVGKDLLDFSLDTVKMFHSDGVKSGYTLDQPTVAVASPTNGAAKKRAST
jgi:transaldolase